MHIYIHLPFCTSICSYCDFPKVFYNKKYIDNYLKILKKEITNRYLNEEVSTIYIGGGTPTSLDINELECLLKITNMFKKNSNIEFTVESNIECLDEEKIKLLKKYGVNRISLGVQSFNNKTLKELNRKHKKEDVINVVKMLKKNGFNNISIDYIYGIHNDIEEIKKDIEEFLKLDIPHISCYSLIIEENTLFSIEKREYIDDDIEIEMYKYIETSLKKNGYKHYEISNYAKEGYQSKHNLAYWDNLEYYGFGMGAVSYLGGLRIHNTKNLTKYLKETYIDTIDVEDKRIDISNTFMLGLRKIDGISASKFYDRYNINILDIKPVKRLIKENKLIFINDYLFINPDYIYLSNEIILEFI